MKDEEKRCLLENLAKNMIYDAEITPDLGIVKKTFTLCNILDLEQTHPKVEIRGMVDERYLNSLMQAEPIGILKLLIR